MRHTFLLALLLLGKATTVISQVTTLSGQTIESSLVDRFLTRQMDSLHIKGLSIAFISQGKVCYHRVFGVSNVYTKEKVNPKTVFEAASLAKPLFAFYVMSLVDKQILTLDKPLYQYFPFQELETDPRYKLITARMVLDHTSGLPNWRGNAPLKLLFTPGTKFSYSGEGYLYLAKVIAHLTHSTLSTMDNLFQKQVAEPLGLKHTHFSINPSIAKTLADAHKADQIVYDSSWDRLSFDPAGGLYSEANDYAKFLIALMDKDQHTKVMTDELFKEQVALPEDDRRRIQAGITGWGLGFSRKPSEYGVNYLHGGNNSGYTSFFLINPDKQIGVVFFSNSDQCNGLKESIEAFITRPKR